MSGQDRSRSEEVFRDFFENSTMGMSMTGMDGKILTNKAFRELLGYTEDELANIKWMTLTHADDIIHDQEEVEERADAGGIAKDCQPGDL